MDFGEARLTKDPIHNAHVIDRLIVCMIVELGLGAFRASVNRIIDEVQSARNDDAWMFWDALSARLRDVEDGVER